MTEEELTYTPAEFLGKEVPYPYPDFHKVVVTVDKIYGCCPISVEGDRYVFDLMMILDDIKVCCDSPDYFERRVICTASLAGVQRYVNAMCLGVSAVDLGIAESGEDGKFMCPAWEPPTCEAAVIYRLHPEPVEKGFIDRYYEHLAKAGHISVPTFYFEKFASSETKALREEKIAEWRKVGSPKFWEGWRNPSCQPKRK